MHRAPKRPRLVCLSHFPLRRVWLPAAIRHELPELLSLGFRDQSHVVLPQDVLAVTQRPGH